MNIPVRKVRLGRIFAFFIVISVAYFVGVAQFPRSDDGAAATLEHFHSALMQKLPGVMNVPTNRVVVHKTAEGLPSVRLVTIDDYTVYNDTGLCVFYRYWPAKKIPYKHCVPLGTIDFGTIDADLEIEKK